MKDGDRSRYCIRRIELGELEVVGSGSECFMMSASSLLLTWGSSLKTGMEMSLLLTHNMHQGVHPSWRCPISQAEQTFERTVCFQWRSLLNKKFAVLFVGSPHSISNIVLQEQKKYAAKHIVVEILFFLQHTLNPIYWLNNWALKATRLNVLTCPPARHLMFVLRHWFQWTYLEFVDMSCPSFSISV